MNRSGIRSNLGIEGLSDGFERLEHIAESIPTGAEFLDGRDRDIDHFAEFLFEFPNLFMITGNGRSSSEAPKSQERSQVFGNIFEGLEICM